MSNSIVNASTGEYLIELTFNEIFELRWFDLLKYGLYYIIGGMIVISNSLIFLAILRHSALRSKKVRCSQDCPEPNLDQFLGVPDGRRVSLSRCDERKRIFCCWRVPHLAHFCTTRCNTRLLINSSINRLINRRLPHGTV